MKALTFNIWNYHAPWSERRRLIASLIQEYHPDVVGLQETRHDFRHEGGRNQGDLLAEDTGYHATSAVGQVYAPLFRIDEGLTILTREPPIDTFCRPLSRLPHEHDDADQRICLGIRLLIRGGEVTVYNTHFSLSAAARQSNASEVLALVNAVSGRAPAVLMGDLNAEPDSPELAALLTDGADSPGFRDAWLEAKPDDVGYTYASFDPVRRIDYVLVRGNVGVVSAERIGIEPRDGVFPSDHAGVLIELDL